MLRFLPFGCDANSTALAFTQAPEALNNIAFQELLAFQRGTKFKENDIPSPVTVIKNIRKRAASIEEELAKQLQVSLSFY